MLDGNENKKCMGVSKNVVNMLLNLMSIERTCLAARVNIEKRMSLEVIVMRFLPKKLTKDHHEVILDDQIYTLAYGQAELTRNKN